MKYKRPHNTTANPNWMHAPNAESMVPTFNDAPDDTLFLKLFNSFLLTQGDVAGQRLGDVAMPWQTSLARAFMHVDEVVLTCGKGSGKTATSAALCLAFTMFSAIRGVNHRGIVGLFSSSVEAARVAYNHLMEAVIADFELAPLFKSNVQTKSLLHVSSGITIQVLSPELHSAASRRFCLIVFDELWQIAQLRDSTEMCNQARLGTRNFETSKIISITTQSTKAPVGEWARLLRYARRVRDGEVEDNRFLPVLYEYPLEQRPDLDVLDSANWWRGMPSLKVGSNTHGTMTLTALKGEFEAAQREGDAGSLALLLSQRLGIQANIFDTGESIVHARFSKLDKCPIQPQPGGQQFLAIDPGGLNDPAAACLLTVHGNRHDFTVFQYLTRYGFDKAIDSNKVVFQEALKFGTLQIFESAEELEQSLFADCAELIRLNPTVVVGGDPLGVAGFRERFEGFLNVPYVPVPQTTLNLSGALNRLEQLIEGGSVRHSGCPLLTYNVQCVAFEETAGGLRKISKQDTGRLENRGKIDGFTAMLSALHMASTVVNRPTLLEVI